MNNKSHIIFFICLAIFVTNCHRKKIFKENAPQGKVKIKKRFQVQNADFKYLNCKSKIEFTDGLENFSSNATIRIRKDSVIWVSVNPALGIEVVRCLINQDSVFVINKLQKEYYIYSFKQLSEKFHFEINYKLVESMLFGNLPFAETEGDSSSSSDSAYTIIQQTRKNIFAENFIRNDSRKLEKLALKDLDNGNSLDINYENFKPLETILFAFTNKLSLNYRNKKGFQNIYIGIEHHKLEPSNQDLKFPFNISHKYERKQ